MNKKRDLYAEKDGALVKIKDLHIFLESKLPKISDFFFAVVVSGFGERVNLKKLYPELYKRVETDMKAMIHDYAKMKPDPKTKKTSWPNPIFQSHLKTEMKYIPKRKKVDR